MFRYESEMKTKIKWSNEPILTTTTTTTTRFQINNCTNWIHF